jgi:hypothetical protein
MYFGAHEYRPAFLQFATVIAISALVLALSGCGNGLAQVSGVVTLDGQPLRGGNDVRATVHFQPTSGSGAAAVGLVDENGRYRLSSGSQEGVAPGEYVVTCSATQLVRSNDGHAAGGRRITDPAYANAGTSGFKFTVAPGKNEFNLALNSRVGSPVGKRAP